MCECVITVEEYVLIPFAVPYVAFEGDSLNPHGPFNQNSVSRIDIYPGQGGDTVVIETDAAWVYGNQGVNENTRIFCDEGNDTVDGGDFADEIHGETGNDTLNGRGGNDSIYGGYGGDASADSSGADVLNGGSGNDLMYGGPGNDSINALDGGSFTDTVDGGDGTDDCDADGADSVINCES